LVVVVEGGDRGHLISQFELSIVEHVSGKLVARHGLPRGEGYAVVHLREKLVSCSERGAFFGDVEGRN
jgi:hypothetical protein